MSNALDMCVLRILKNKDKFDLYHRTVPTELLEPHTRVILADFGKFFEESQAPKATPETFVPWFLLAHPKLKDEPRAMLTAVLNAALGTDLDQNAEAALLSRFDDARHAAALTSMLERYQMGDEVSVTRTVQQIAESIPVSRDTIPDCSFDLDASLDDSENDQGLHWRLACLNESMRGLRGGDFGILAARVDQGKGTLLASELSFMAPQIEGMFGPDRGIIILNNESVGDRYYQRLVSATLNMHVLEMVEARKQGRDLWAETLRAWGGRQMIEVYDVHDRPMSYLENMVRRLRPAVVVLDMIDNIPFDGTTMNGGSRTDQILEAAYQRARIWGAKYGCVVLATSQLNGDAAGKLFPGMHELSNSKTGKAGAADFVLCLGHSDDPTLKNSRWIGLPKNKLHRPGSPKDPHCEVQFDGARARITNPTTLYASESEEQNA